MLVLVPTLMLMLFTAVIGTDGITLRYYPDPSGYFEAEVRIADEGATGGHTVITIYQAWPFGPLRVVRGQTSMQWIDPETLDVEWIDNDTLSVNGEMWHWH